MPRIDPGSAPVQVRVDGGSILNYGPGDIVYADDQNVTVDNYDGIIVAGSSLAYSSSLWALAPTAPATYAVQNSPSTVTPGARHAPGRYYYPVTLPSAASALTVNQLMAMPIGIGNSVTLDRICCNIGVGGTAGSVVRLGLYADDGMGSPGALILDAGTINGTTTGAHEITISQALTAGWVWVAGVAQVAAPQVARPQGMFQPFGYLSSTVTNSALASAYIHNGTVSGALPTLFLPTTTNVGFMVSVRAA